MARSKSRTNPPRQNLAKYLFIWCAAAAVCSRFHPVSFASDDTNHRQPRQHLLLPSLLPPPLPTTTTTLLFHNPAGLFGRRSNPATYLRGHPGPTFSSMAVLPLPFHHPIATHPGLQLEVMHPQCVLLGTTMWIKITWTINALFQENFAKRELFRPPMLTMESMLIKLKCCHQLWTLGTPIRDEGGRHPGAGLRGE